MNHSQATHLTISDHGDSPCESGIVLLIVFSQHRNIFTPPNSSSKTLNNILYTFDIKTPKPTSKTIETMKPANILLAGLLGIANAHPTLQAHCGYSDSPCYMDCYSTLYALNAQMCQFYKDSDKLKDLKNNYVSLRVVRHCEEKIRFL